MLSLFKALSDKSRLRTLLMLMRRELCVCQLMEILKVSQPLVSRNLNLLHGAGLIQGRREGKLVFYSMRKDLPEEYAAIFQIVEKAISSDPVLERDLKGLKRCEDFMDSIGRCDVKLFRAYMRGSRRKVLKITKAS